MPKYICLIDLRYVKEFEYVSEAIQQEAPNVIAVIAADIPDASMIKFIEVPDAKD